MVFLCDNNYNSKTCKKYEEYFNSFPFELDNFQKWSVEAIETNKNLLVTAHTGSGKSMPFEYAIQKYCIRENKKIIYTSPIKSLSNQKYNELIRKYPSVSFGILTGDIKFNPEAQCLIMTTEILRNTLFQLDILKNQIKNKNIEEENNNKTKLQNNNFEEKIKSTLQFDMDIENELASVIFDEVHYINDNDRGKVWEETIMKLPKHIQLIMLSATIDKPKHFASWIEKIKSKETWVASTNIRVVPLTHYSFSTLPKSLIKKVGEKDKSMEYLIHSIHNKLQPIRENNGKFYDENIIKIHKINTFLSKNRLSFVKKKFILNEICKFCKNNCMLPAICFVFSRKNIENFAFEIDESLFDENNLDEVKYPSIIEKECKKIVMKLPNYKEYLQLPEYTNLIKLMQKGIAIHHSGIMPIFREMIEIMFEKGFIKFLFATETFAVGINMPTKTVIFTSLSKYSNNGFRYLLPHEYTQMAGRAGRRGLDKIGNVIHLNNMFETPILYDYKNILCGKPQTLISKFKPYFNLILKIISSNSYKSDIINKNDNGNNIIDENKFLNFNLFTEKSLNYNEILNKIEFEEKELQNYVKEFEERKEKLTHLSTKIEDLENYYNLKIKLQYSKNKQRKKIEKKIKEFEDKSGKYFKKDYNSYIEFLELNKTIREKKEYIENLNSYNNDNIQKIINILEKCDFIHKNREKQYYLTEKGIIASNIQEINGLVFAELYNNKVFHNETLTSTELAMLFCCYAGIKVFDDYKIYKYNGNNETFKYILDELENINTHYYNIELKELESNMDIESYTIQYDFCEILERWIKAENEDECKSIIYSLYEKEIFLGEFVKIILKINNIGMEIQKICELTENYDLLQKLIEMREKTLKFIATNQSLYI